MEEFDKTISNLVQNQFPDFYKNEGPVFVEFVKKYFEWLETNYDTVNKDYNGKGTVSINAGNNVVVGKNTDFTDHFSNNANIAIFTDNVKKDNFTIYTINTISNSTYLYLTTNPSFSGQNLYVSNTSNQYNPLYYARNLYDLDDIDSTTDEFMVFFKEKYLKNIQFETRTNTRLLLKHALDIYRSKGTERSVDLLFRIVFGTPASIYYPGSDLFKLSDGVWKQPKYLEISVGEYATQLVNKQIRGDDSRATAFVEAVVRKKIKNKFVDLLYISDINGNFITNEYINSTDNILTVKQKPTIIGSLTSMEVSSGGTGSNYNIGDTVDIYSDNGEQGLARVTGTVDLNGTVDFELVNGGYAYTNNSEILISEKILNVNNVRIDANNTLLNYFNPLEVIIQPMANIVYNTLNGSFANNSLIYTYYANNLLKGTGRVLTSTATNSTAGYVLASILSGNLNSTKILSTSNTSNAVVSSYADKTATANVIGYSGNSNFYVINKTGNFIIGEEIYQTNAVSNTEYCLAHYLNFSEQAPNEGIMSISNLAGVFLLNKLIAGRTSGATANLQTVSLSLGIIDEANAFVSTLGNYVYAQDSLSNTTVTSISQGSGATFTIVNNLSYTETVNLNTDLISPYLNVALNATNYGFPGMPTANLNTIIDDALTFESFTIGRIDKISGINPGSDYNNPPMVRILEPYTACYEIHDYYVYVDSVDGAFQIGELATQSATGGRGFIKTANSTVITLERLNFNSNNVIIPTVNSTTMLIGENSNAAANMSIVYADARSNYLGYNAIVDTTSTIAEGAISSAEIIDSGFGYANNEQVVMYNSNNSNIAVGYTRLGRPGKSLGYYRQKGGFLSDQKKLFDGEYYQEYSYEVRSSIALMKYEDMLKQLLHVAGTKYFGALIHKAYTNSSIYVTSNTTITVS